MDMVMSEERFDRIENKLDKLVEAVLTMSHLHGEVVRNSNRLDKVEQKLHQIEQKMPLLDVMLSTIGKVGGGVLLLIVAGLIGGYYVL